MPQTGPQGTQTVYTGGPGTSMRGPLYTKVFGNAEGSSFAGGGYTYNQLVDSAGLVHFNALHSSILNVATITLTNTQVNGMYAAPVQLIAAPAAGSVILIDSVVWNVVYGSAAFASGGALGLYYGASNQTYPATATVAATFLTSPGGGTANGLALALGALATGTASSNQIASAVSVSNATQAFTTGTGCSLVVTAYYAILSGVQ